MVLYGNGTTSSSTLELLGLNNEKGIILSVVRTDMIKKVLNTLEEKFKIIRNGKGVACVVQISSVIGLSIYQKVRLDTPGQGIAFTVPVDDIVEINKNITFKKVKKEVANEE